MAEVYHNGKTRMDDDWGAELLANLPGVQAHITALTFEAKAKADNALLSAREANGGSSDGDAFTHIEHGDIDVYLVLNDEAGQDAAMSIEFGRKGGSYEVLYEDTGEVVEVKYAATEGLFILHNAFNLDRRQGPKVAVDIPRKRVVRASRKRGKRGAYKKSKRT
ncbi:hypothetical protein [Micromonospora sp. NPDC048839]|uniref:hypothetical protein n=1 Tax=Micromonospora sp. NPDC048839 TaxID=3155641 RepID=UPI0033CD4B38